MKFKMVIEFASIKMWSLGNSYMFLDKDSVNNNYSIHSLYPWDYVFMTLSKHCKPKKVILTINKMSTLSTTCYQKYIEIIIRIKYFLKWFKDPLFCQMTFFVSSSTTIDCYSPTYISSDVNIWSAIHVV